MRFFKKPLKTWIKRNPEKDKVYQYFNDPRWEQAKQLADQMKFADCQRVVQSILDDHPNREHYAGYSQFIENVQKRAAEAFGTPYTYL